MGSASTNIAVYTIRVDRALLEEISQIAEAEYRTLAQKLRLMMELEVAAHRAADGKAA